MTASIQSAAPGQEIPTSHSKFWHNLIHHFVTAAVLSCCVLLTEIYTPWLHWLDSVALRIALPISSNGPLLAPERQPVVISISDTLYEQVFGQSSPLDRDRMSELLNAVQKSRPGLVAIDLDLSPAAGDAMRVAERRRLDQAIADLAAHSRVVLAVPARTATLQDSQHRWIIDMCRRGVNFGLPMLSASMNTVVRHDVATPLLANVAWDVGQGKLAAHSQSKLVCSWATENDSNGFFDKVTTGQDGHADKTIPLKTALLSPSNLHRQTVEPEWNAIHGFSLPNLAGKTVFLGGAWGKSDNVFTALSSRSHPGVFVHAAAYSTRLSPVENTSHRRAFAIDIVIGTLLGFLFHWVWSKIIKFKESLTQANKNKTLVKILLWDTPRLRLAMLLGWVPPLLILVLFFLFSAALLNRDLWLNPGPLVIGMTIDAILAAKTDPENGAHQHKPSEDTNWLGRIVRSFPDLVWQLPLFFATVVIVGLFAH